MAIRLNNEGQPDLDIWKRIQQDFLHEQKPSEVIIFHCAKDNNSNYFSAGKTLLDLKTVKQSSKEEKFMLRIYDLIASLTKRIMTTEFTPEDSRLYHTLIETFLNLTEIFQDETIAEKLTNAGAMKRVKHCKTAQLINTNIAKTMKSYFKL